MGPRSSKTRDGDHDLALAETLHGQGRLLEAIRALAAANVARRDPEIERRLVRLRHEAFAAIDRATAPVAWPPPIPTDVVHAGDPPVVPPEEMTVELVRHGVFCHGCVLVRGLVPPARVEVLVDGIDRAFAGYDAHAAGTRASETTPWFEPFKPDPPYTVGAKRKWSRAGGGVLAGDSPRVLFDLLDTIEAVGLADVITGFLGERPALSWNKSVLRRVSIDGDADWHQDGAFLGRDIRSLNVWIALSRCGDDAPGLDIVPRRLHDVVATGTDGASFSWSVSPENVETALEGAPVWRPQFEPGDVLLFDHLMLHRTSWDASMTRARYATETWFFAPSDYPGTQIPFVL